MQKQIDMALELPNLRKGCPRCKSKLFIEACYPSEPSHSVEEPYLELQHHCGACYRVYYAKGNEVECIKSCNLPRRKDPDDGQSHPIYLLQRLQWSFIGDPPLGWCWNEDGETFVNEKTGEIVHLTMEFAKEHCENYVESWDTESVWFTREEAQTWLDNHQYRYEGTKGRVYGVQAEGDLWELVNAHTDYEP